MKGHKNGTYDVWSVILDLTMWNENGQHDPFVGGYEYFLEGGDYLMEGLGKHKGVYYRPLGPSFEGLDGENSPEGPMPHMFPQV
jgi:hypothetical protein